MGDWLRKTRIVEWFMLVIGTGLMSLAVSCIYDPTGMVVGGFSGIAILVRHMTTEWVNGGIPLWFTTGALNVPVFFITWKIMGRKYVERTIVTTILFSVWLYVLPEWNFPQGDIVLAAVYGGICTGVGLGMILLSRSSTGGTDLLAVLIYYRLRKYSVVQIMMVLDGIIIVLGAVIFGIPTALYGLVAIYLTTKVSDNLMEGMNYAKAVYIISDQAEIIAQKIMEQLERGMTGLEATGMYSGQHKTLLYCVVSKKELVTLKSLVKSMDSKAFFVISDVREVYGEGFLE